jgi:hypothetical protein
VYQSVLEVDNRQGMTIRVGVTAEYTDLTGLWVGYAAIDHVSQPADRCEPCVPKPTGSEFQFPLILDVDANDVSTATVTYRDVQGGWSGTGNIDADPLFVNAAGGDLRLASDVSPCVDAGDNNTPGLPATDLAGNPRVVDGSAVVDMEVLEYGRVRNITQNAIYVTIQAAIEDANDGDEIEVPPVTLAVFPVTVLSELARVPST